MGINHYPLKVSSNETSSHWVDAGNPENKQLDFPAWKRLLHILDDQVNTHLNNYLEIKTPNQGWQPQERSRPYF